MVLSLMSLISNQYVISINGTIFDEILFVVKETVFHPHLTLHYSEEIKRLRAEGERILEEEQAKYDLAKKHQLACARVKLQWDARLKKYGVKGSDR